FTRGVVWRHARKADRNMLASVNPVLDPLLVSPLRNAVVHSAWGRGKIDIPPGIARKLNDTTVVTSTTPVAPKFRPDLAKRMRVNNAPDHAKGQKFQVRDERQERGRGGPPQQSAQAPAPVQQQQRPAQVEQRDRGQEQRGRGQEQREARRAEQPQQQRPQPQQQQPRGQQKQAERRASAPQAERPARPVRQEQPRGERVAAPARPQPQAQQPKHERPPQAQKQQQPKQERGNPGKGKGKKP
ncbi:MAG TPA: hypothetical protein VFH96_06380, partial [Pyrinomonadaceae bacterium]|nr:hypothetical protein [Pyrinomonadaceae bacterium]